MKASYRIFRRCSYSTPKHPLQYTHYRMLSTPCHTTLVNRAVKNLGTSTSVYKLPAGTTDRPLWCWTTPPFSVERASLLHTPSQTDLMLTGLLSVWYLKDSLNNCHVALKQNIWFYLQNIQHGMRCRYNFEAWSLKKYDTKILRIAGMKEMDFEKSFLCSFFSLFVWMWY